MKRLLFILAGLTLISAVPSQAALDKRVKVYADLDKPVIMSGTPENVVIRVGLSAPDMDFVKQRIPLNLAIVLDKSGSMGSQNKIQNARSAALEIIDRLNPNDIVSLIVYDSRAWVMVPAQPLKDKGTFTSAINRINADGSTALYDGVSLGARELRKNLSSEYFNKVILLSDGLANIGPSSTEEIASLGDSLESDGITITTVGVGLDYNENLMGALAESSGGNTYFAQDSDRLPEIFAQEIDESMTLAAQKVKIRVECADGVVPVGSIGRKAVYGNRDMELTINNLYGKNEKSAMFEVQVPAGKPNGNLEVARVTVEYFDPKTQETVSERQAVNIRFDSNQAVVDKALNKEILKDAELTRTSEIKQQAIALADQGHYQEADALLQQRGADLEKVAQQCDNDAELMEEAKKNKSSSWSENAKKGTTNFFRKRMHAESQSQIGQQYEPGYSDYWGSK
ncbi:MAG: VWA domain-containing protein [Candidatus Omnitrophota bacterium]|nr:VWA domain-containing protein [Candidatus Omnitrophota bacterium]MDZ4242226.1 VWA domain-containing protein [Candidatus Omnitrophota bacterium]